MSHSDQSRFPRWLLAGALASLGVVGVAQAERADRDAPMNIEADALLYDDASRTSTFTGNVVITKGSILMRGTRVVVRQDEQGHQLGRIEGDRNAQGLFRQKREGLEEWIEGRGDRIEYDSRRETVRLLGGASLRRYRGTELSDEAQGGEIVYNSASEVFSVQGGTEGRTAENPTGRVRAMITPAPRSEPGQATPPESPASLRPSTRMEETRP
ncbi:MAG TPA: lipopolysaccharide transport periplasmic protein LptA [Hydrogenophaga sp.]|uniref:lipopolysaccharide transport periplasmic protein LptA n=1 Tax=Hydrogenophaga sp. TaxID=1904254 RepID=UPI002B9F1143|nr:lipopolysaccharide transport periplasmic protein LptA [Hydrogenophaga sp.]HMN92873.1 lipopolysaccharide transport periplasmic protein LptA [Hydrogenophaga sp.]HMP10900.1 lipopolysaccharide transport periplasmic protein LptA [Hydrogenophaga sp.]